jgi:tetratricopeptide (TPR) repeat protein/uncharacterized membrane protein YgcG
MLRTTGRFLAVALAVIVAAPNLSHAATHPSPDNTSSSSSSASGARFEAYAKPDGSKYFALSLMPQATLPPAATCDVVVLFDTSAHEMGPYREKGLEMLRGLLATLGNNDRVKLMAVDLKAVPLTKTFVSPRGPEMQAAMAELQRRVPLGATDLEAALQGIHDSFAATPDTQRAAVYIGDGQSNANLEGRGAIDLIDHLAQQHVSVNSFVVGPGNNSAVLAALANQTGGVVLLDSDKLAGREVGAQFAQSVHEPVIWPTERKLPESITSVFPAQTPPLRSDRDTVLLGTGTADGIFPVQINGQSAGQPIELKWDVKATAPSDDNAYLAQWVDFAKRDGGHRLPTLGSEGLWAARRISNQQAHQLAELGRQAASQGDVKQAKLFVDQSLRDDPNNANALVLKQSMDSGILHADNGGAGATARPVALETPANSTPPQPGDAEPKPGDLMNSIEQTQRLVQQKVMTDAGVAMTRARDMMVNDPAQSLTDLKLLFDEVMRVGELTSDQRLDLRSRITALMQQASERRFEKEAADVQREQNAAEARDRKRILDNLVVHEEHLKGLIDRFNALVEQGCQNYDQVQNEQLVAARRDAADEFRRASINPYGRQPAATTTAPIFAGFVLASVQNAAVREASERNFMDTMHLVDISSIPFPDSPPIVYPDAAFWRKITKDRAKWASVDLSSKPAEEKIIRELNDPNNLITLDFNGQPLSDVVAYLADKYPDIPAFIFDQAALKEAGVDPTTSLVTIKVKDISLRSALRLILSQFNLTYIIKDEVPQITTKDKADATLVTRAYYVGDLVVPIINQGVNTGQLGGGLGGMIGGGGGGGLGGGGGGGGGLGGLMGGGGGLGGGGFSVPPETNGITVPTPASGGALDVNDSQIATPQKAASLKSTTTKATSEHVSVAAPSPAPTDTKSTPAPAPIAVDANTDPDTAWNNYFAGLKEPDEKQAAEVMRQRNATIAETAKELMDGKQFNQVSALLQAALRNGYAQPWMYEALGLALQAANRPQEEVERALMSAADFAHSATDLMNIGIYLARLGLDARALQVLQQASALEPFRPEPYMHGLEIAQRLNNIDGIRWACLGVLSQAWPNDKKEIAQSARFAADALLEKLRGQGQMSQADEFRKQLDEAQARDCVVKVTWTGDADIDLTVQEPTGAVCTFSNPRTTGGGVMQGDTYAKVKAPGSDGSSEYSQSYVLPQGFSGQYKVLLRRLWGQVATGKVTVDVYTHFGTTKVVHIHKQIPVSDRDALINFDLVDGRRTEPLEQAQLATATENQKAISRAVLSQQLSEIDNGSSLNEGFDAPNAAANGPVVTPKNFAFLRPGPAGYQPQIIVLPEGANLFATAVVSADRRYVRVSPSPVFSTIGAVTTFNFATGQTGTSGTTSGTTSSGGGTSSSGGSTIGGGGGGGLGGGGGF